MIELNKIEHIYIYPGYTDMRLGIFGLRKKILETGELKINSLYMFCSRNRNQVKIIEVTLSSTWLYQNKLMHGDFVWPNKGDKAELTKEELKLIIEGSGLIKAIEHKGESTSLF